MRILLVSEDVPFANMGGLAKHALALGRALGLDGHQVDFMGNADQPFSVGTSESEMPGHFFAELRGTQRGWKEHRLGCFIPLKRDVIAKGIASAILARAANYDVVHYHGHYPNVGAYLPAGINFVQTRHDQGADCLIHTRFRNGTICVETDPQVCAECISKHPNRVQRMVSATAVRSFRKQVAIGFARHKTIFVSDMLRRNYVRGAGSKNSGTVIHNFLEVSQFEQALTRRRSSRGLDQRIGVLVAAKLYPPKGVDRFLEATKGRLAPHIHITIAGAGPDEDALRRRFSGDQVSFLGWQDYSTVLQLTAAADAVVVPSVWEEPCATTVLEAMFLGRQVFALNQGGTPELARYAKCKGQLRLYPDLESLVLDLNEVQRIDRTAMGNGEGFAVGSRLPEVMKVYEARNQ